MFPLPFKRTLPKAVLITGESGAGKTYNTKKALAFIDMINEVKTIELTGSRPEV